MSLYNDIAIILRESLKNTPYLIPIVETFSRYFNEKDGKFSKRQFKSACFNGKKMENTKENVDIEIIKSTTKTYPQYTYHDISYLLNDADEAMRRYTERTKKKIEEQKKHKT